MISSQHRRPLRMPKKGPQRTRQKRPKNYIEKQIEELHVYVIARPLNVANQLNLSFLSDGKLPLCHWGILFSDYDPNEINCRLSSIMLDQSLSSMSSLGTVIELHRT